MKYIFAILLFFALSSSAQNTLTQINSWNAWVYLPNDYYTTTQNYPTIIFFPGLGEVGTDPNKLIAQGPNRYIQNGWNGITTVPGRTVKWIVISLQPPAAYPNEIAINTRLQTIKTIYRTDHSNIFLTGLSHGGWCAMTFVTGDTYGGPYNYVSQINGVVSVQGMKSDDNQPWPALYDNFAQVGGSMLNFENINDARGGDQAVARMNLTRPGSAFFMQTNLGGGGHCCFSTYYNGGVFPIEGINQTMYEWMARKIRNVVALPIPTSYPQQPTKPFFYFTDKAIILNSKHRNEYVLVNVLGQIVMRGSYTTGENIINITKLPKGVYYLKTIFGTYKLLL